MSTDGIKMIFSHLTRKEKKELELIEFFSKKEEKEPSPQEILGYRPFPQQLSWVEWAFDGKSREKLFLGARGYGKTDLVTIFGVVKKLLENPSLTFLIMTRTQVRCQDIVRTIGDSLVLAGVKGEFLRSSIWLPESPVHPKTNRKQPSVRGITVNGRTKGHHADFLIMDDPMEPADAYMPAIKNRVKKVYAESGNIAKTLIIIGQYVSEDDLYVELEGKIDTLTAWNGTIPDLDEDREEFLKTRTERDWGLNHGGFIISGDFLPFKEIETIKAEPVGTVFSFLDPSFKGEDFTALSIGWRINDFIVVRGFVFRESWSRSLPKILKILKENGATRNFYEDNGLGDALYFASESALKPFTSKGNKEGRISRIESIVQNGKVKIRVPETKSEEEFLKMVKNWNPLGAAFDDAPDSLASLCKIFGVI